MFDVFLSYSREDEAAVQSLAEQLRSDGLKVWFDKWVLAAGDNIPAKIDEGLENTRVLVLCMSAHALGSDWARLESYTFRFRDPLNKERRFIPLRLDNAPIQGSLAQFLYIDWRAGDRKTEYAKLLQGCRPVPASAGSLSSFGINPNDYPTEVQALLSRANLFELHGEFWDAQATFDKAAETLLQPIKDRADYNGRLGKDLRKEYKGNPEPTLVKVFDENGLCLGNEPKLEVHEKGLLHHTVILLVQIDGKVVFYRRHRLQTHPNKLDFFGGHTADVDSSPSDTARREANEELQLYANGIRMTIPDAWIHRVGEEHQFHYDAPHNRERSTLFVVELPRHPGISLRVSDEGADGQCIVSIPDYEVDSLSNLLKVWAGRKDEFADGAERVLAEIQRNLELRKALARWFPDVLQ